LILIWKKSLAHWTMPSSFQLKAPAEKRRTLFIP
jgi:hypothetical protein